MRAGVKSRVVAVASVVGLAMGVGVLGAQSASAGSREPTDVTATVLSNIVLVSPATMSMNATRQADYAMNPPAYMYTTNIEGLGSEESKACTLTFNSTTLREGTCWTLTGFGAEGLDQTGNYVLKTATQTLASWTFTNPGDTPPALAPALCQIKSIKTLNVTKKGAKFQVKTNGQCSSGTWTSWSDPGTYEFGAGKKKTFTFTNQWMLKKDLPTKMELKFTPTEDLRETVKSIRVR